MPDPDPCDPEIFANGTCVQMTHSIGRSAVVEQYVQKIAAQSGQRVDWHFAAGRVIVKALGDIGKVLAVIEAMKPEHDQNMTECERNSEGSLDYERSDAMRLWLTRREAQYAISMFRYSPVIGFLDTKAASRIVGPWLNYGDAMQVTITLAPAKRKRAKKGAKAK